MNTIKHDLKMLLDKLLKDVPHISALYLFGSRAYKTGSTRSDCDILVKVEEGRHVKSSLLRDFAMAHCTALDFFITIGGHATSCMNDSFIFAETFERLAERLDAIELWNKEQGFLANPVDWIFETNSLAEFVPTSLPNASITEINWHTMIKKAEQLELPTYPYIGDTVDKAVVIISDVAKRMVLKSVELGQNGEAKKGWTVNLKSEYDCQNLFYTVVKPWIPAIGREEVTIVYDQQNKIADFNLFRNRLIVELKYIDSDNKKREIVKTLDGLSRFYVRNGNIEVLLLLIFVKEGVALDDRRWEADYTFYNSRPRVIVHVIRVP